MKNFALLLFVVIAYMGCSKKNHIEDMKTLNVGDVIFDESTGQLHTKSGTLIDIQKYKEANVALKATSLEVIASTNQTFDFFYDVYECDECGYRVEIDHHIWWGAGVYDEGGDIGMDSSGGAFLFRPGQLYMSQGTFIYRGRGCKSLRFLAAALEEDPTNSIIKLQPGQCSGPAMQYAAGGGI